MKVGREKLSQLQEGKNGIVTWDGTQQISRREPQGLDNEILRAVFKAEVTTLPSYAGVANSKGGFTLIRVNRVIDPTPAEASERKTFARQ